MQLSQAAEILLATLDGADVEFNDCYYEVSRVFLYIITWFSHIFGLFFLRFQNVTNAVLRRKLLY